MSLNDQTIKNELGFVGKYGVTGEVVAASSKQAGILAQQILAAGSVVGEGIKYGAGVAITTAALGNFDGVTTGLGLIAGAVAAFGKGSSHSK